MDRAERPGADRAQVLTDYPTKVCDPGHGRSGIGPRTSRVGANAIVAPLFIGARPPYLGGHGHSHAVRACRRRNAAARSRPHCRQRHRCSLGSIRRLSCVSGCPRPQWLGIFSHRSLRRSKLGKWTTAVLLVQSTPPLPRLSGHDRRHWQPRFAQPTRIEQAAD
jgi:hypothetical protein